MLKIPSNSLGAGAMRITQQLQKAGFIAYFAGGCLRDMLMDRIPKDYDIATNATPDQILQLFPQSVTVGKAFGVVIVRIGKHSYEVATFRKDHAYSDGRHPDAVTFSDPQMDARRRDFTINALFFDPHTQRIYDFVNGKKDIENRIIRTVGNPDQRFEEDHLRMLRAIRFAFTFDFKFAPDTISAVKKHACKINRISSERIQQELTRILLESQKAGDAINCMQEVGLLKQILPEVDALKGQAQPPQFHPEGDVFTHIIIMLNAQKDPDLQLAYAILLHDIGKPPTAKLVNGRIRFDNHARRGAVMAEKILRRLRMPLEDIKAITFAVANHMRFMDVKKMKRSTLRRLIAAPTFPVELNLHYLDCMASHGDISNHQFLLNIQKELQATPVLPKPLITGHDIMKFGIQQGPEVGKWKKSVYNAQLDGLFTNRETAIAWLKKHIIMP